MNSDNERHDDENRADEERDVLVTESSETPANETPAEETSAEETSASPEEAAVEPVSSGASASEGAKSDVTTMPEAADTLGGEPAGDGPSEIPIGADGEPIEFNWYVLQVQSGREDTCANALRKKILLAEMQNHVREIAVPKQKVTEMKDGKKKVRSEKLFPSYIFLNVALTDELWYMIRDTSGIGDFVGAYRKPTPMPPEEVKKITSMMEEKEDDAPEIKIDLEKNDGVKIKEGPFENFDGVVDEILPTKGMVRVMVTIFGRATPVDLEYWQVEKL